MPELALVRIKGASGDQYVTLILNRAHLNITSMFGEQKNVAPEEDTLSVIPGFIGSLPEHVFCHRRDRSERLRQCRGRAGIGRRLCRLCWTAGVSGAPIRISGETAMPFTWRIGNNTR